MSTASRHSQRPSPLVLSLALAGLALSGYGGPVSYREAYRNGHPKALGELDGWVALGACRKYTRSANLVSNGMFGVVGMSE